MICTKGERYDVESLVFAAWVGGDGDYDGYAVGPYFDADGRYLGPDAFGVEPEFGEADD